VSRDDSLWLEDIREACRKVTAYSQGLSREELLADGMRMDAIIRNLQIIGEASGRLSDVACMSMPEIPWADIVGMRNILTHVYFGVDPLIVWDVVKNKIPLLDRAVADYVERA
jgi:uncharacterized protein with HEPN domain